MSQKIVLVACGTAVATSTVVAQAIEEAMTERGISVAIRQCKVTEVFSQIDDVDLVVSTTPLPEGLNKPSLTTLAFLTGIGKEEIIEKIASHLVDRC